MTKLLNYTTKVPVNRTIGEITGTLVSHGSTSVLTEYDKGQITGLAFKINTIHGVLAYRLPVRVNAVAKIFNDDNLPGRNDPAQPTRTAWRILKDWVESQMALIDTEMVSVEEVFLPYMISNSGKTVYEIMCKQNFMMLQGGEKREKENENS